MRLRLRLVALTGWWLSAIAMSAGQAPRTATGTIHVDTRLVVLDARVVDKAGGIVTQPLGRDDLESADAPFASRVTAWMLSAPQGSDKSGDTSKVSVTVPAARQTQKLRFVVRDTSTGGMGTVDVSPAALVSAPVVKTAGIDLQHRPETKAQ